MSPSPVLKIIDFIDEVLNNRSSEKGRENTTVLTSYVVFAVCAIIVWRQFSDRDFSTVLTLGSGIQCLGFFLLLQKIRAQRSAAGISARTLHMYVVMFVFRLTSTCIKNGYLPVDKSGDWVYQAADIFSLVLVFQLLYAIHVTHRLTYQSDLDTLPIYVGVIGCLALAVMFHGNLNHAPFYDICWFFAMNVDTIAMLPQLWLMVRKGGEVEALTSHYVASIAISRALAFAFWWHGFQELAPKKGGFNISGWLIIACHGVQLLLSGDFLYHYTMWGTNGKASGGLVLSI